MATEKTISSDPKSKLIQDIKPIPIKDRSRLGVVELTLEPGVQVKAVGVIYGLEHQVQGEGFEARFFLDHYSQRVKVLDYSGENLQGMLEKVRWIADANGFDKIIYMASRSDWQRFLRRGYVLEAVLKYFHNGEDAYVMSKFRSQERLTSMSLFEEIELIETLMENDPKPLQTRNVSNYEFRLAEKKDVPELIELYQRIFETYPSPLIHGDYLNTVFQKDSLFAVASQGGKIVAAASAELFKKEKAAELTDCATLPEARGKGLMSEILVLLEKELLRREYICAYTMARARSYGMNNVFYQLGYEFSGRLVNNCDIYGAYEDMNIWVKNIKS